MRVNIHEIMDLPERMAWNLLRDPERPDCIFVAVLVVGDIEWRRWSLTTGLLYQLTLPPQKLDLKDELHFGLR